MRTGHVSGSYVQSVANLLELLKTNATRIFVSLLKDVSRQCYKQPLNSIRLEIIKSGCVFEGLFPELKNQDGDNH